MRKKNGQVTNVRFYRSVQILGVCNTPFCYIVVLIEKNPKEKEM